MNEIILIFIISVLLNGILIYAGLKLKESTTKNENIQSLHNVAIPRLGGIAIFFTCLIYLLFFNTSDGSISLILILSSIPVVIAGLLDDLSLYQSITFRYLSALFSAIIVIWLSNIYITTTSVFFLDYLLSFYTIAIIFTIIASSGVSNSFNLIDGVNGFSSGLAILICMSLFFISSKLGENEISNFILIFGFSILGFFVWNFPFSKIFLGDNGAFFIGHILFWVAIILSEKNTAISQWAILLLFLHPVMESILSITRRILNGTYIYKPDREHIHTLIFDKIVSKNFKELEIKSKNNLTSLISFAIAFPSIIFGYLFMFEAIVAMYSVFILSVFYIIFYIFLSKKKN